jgi:AMMECR1 domain-containing protein
VTALGAQRPVTSWRNIELGRHGIVLERRGRKAVFLPQVPLEQHWTLPETLEALARKAGLEQGEWRRAGTRLSVFLGQVFRESHDPRHSDRKAPQTRSHPRTPGDAGRSAQGGQASPGRGS